MFGRHLVGGVWFRGAGVGGQGCVFFFVLRFPDGSGGVRGFLSGGGFVSFFFLPSSALWMVGRAGEAD